MEISSPATVSNPSMVRKAPWTQGNKGFLVNHPFLSLEAKLKVIISSATVLTTSILLYDRQTHYSQATGQRKSFTMARNLYDYHRPCEKMTMSNVKNKTYDISWSICMYIHVQYNCMYTYYRRMTIVELFNAIPTKRNASVNTNQYCKIFCFKTKH